ncbi:MAG: ABC transporter permease, partial [Flavobacterium sp.]
MKIVSLLPIKSNKMKLSINYEIALTHILTRKRQTLVAAMGVTIGIALYIFSNSIVSGFGMYSKNNMFKSVPHLRVYNKDKISQPLFESKNAVVVIRNPKITTLSNNIINPFSLLTEIKKQPYITFAAPQVKVDMFYINGKSQLKGVSNGVNILEADAMFNIQSTMLAGNLPILISDLNAIVIGNGVAEKLNIGIDDNITISSAQGVKKIMRVVGIFSSGNKAVDESKSYIHIAAAQQLVQQNSNFVTDIYASITNPDEVENFAQQLQEITTYDVEHWKEANADQLAQDNMLGTMTPLISFSIMLVAAFGIYNILNMTITQKMNDIAILKANGFKGKDIVTIFVTEAFIMGFVGTSLGLDIGFILVSIMQNVYVGEPIGYFPIFHDLKVYITGAIFGLLVSLGAGYFPARKASKIDP